MKERIDGTPISDVEWDAHMRRKHRAAELGTQPCPRRCVECAPDVLHHWLDDCDELTGEPMRVCKHCDAEAEWVDPAEDEEGDAEPWPLPSNHLGRNEDTFDQLLVVHQEMRTALQQQLGDDGYASMLAGLQAQMQITSLPGEMPRDTARRLMSFALMRSTLGFSFAADTVMATPLTGLKILKGMSESFVVLEWYLAQIGEPS